MNFSQGHSGTKTQCESRLFSQGETPEFTKMGEIHELFVLVLSLVWFAGATPDKYGKETSMSNQCPSASILGIGFIELSSGQGATLNYRLTANRPAR